MLNPDFFIILWELNWDVTVLMRKYLWETALCYKCILDFCCELLKSRADLIKIP